MPPDGDRARPMPPAIEHRRSVPRGARGEALGRTRPRAHPRRPAPRRPRAARARPAGEGLRLARRVVVGRPRAAPGLGRAAARASRGSVTRCSSSTTCSPSSTPIAARGWPASPSGYEQVIVTAAVEEDVPRGLRARVVRVDAGRIIAPDDAGARMPELSRPRRRDRARDDRDLSAPARSGAVGADVPQAPTPRRRRRERARSPPDATRTASATCSPTSPVRPAGTRSSRARTSCGSGPRSPATTPRGTPTPVAFDGRHADRPVRLDGVGEEPPAHARADRHGDRPAVPGSGCRRHPLHRPGRPLLEMGSQNRLQGVVLAIPTAETPPSYPRRIRGRHRGVHGSA